VISSAWANRFVTPWHIREGGNMRSNAGAPPTPQTWACPLREVIAAHLVEKFSVRYNLKTRS
jgi:hypothetical protein